MHTRKYKPIFPTFQNFRPSPHRVSFAKLIEDIQKRLRSEFEHVQGISGSSSSNNNSQIQPELTQEEIQKQLKDCLQQLEENKKLVSNSQAVQQANGSQSHPKRKHLKITDLNNSRSTHPSFWRDENDRLRGSNGQFTTVNGEKPKKRRRY